MKKTLLSLGLMITFSFIMLMGTTYAWFSETITVSDNTIRTGTFDIDMRIADPTELMFVDSSATVTETELEDPFDLLTWYDLDVEGSKIFDNDYLYPGYIDYRLVKISNTGEIDTAVTLKTHNGYSTNQSILDSVEFVAVAIDTENLGVLPLLIEENYQDFEAPGYLVLEPGQTVTLLVAYHISEDLGEDGEEQFLQFDVTLEALQVQELQSKGYENYIYLSEIVNYEEPVYLSTKIELAE